MLAPSACTISWKIFDWSVLVPIRTNFIVQKNIMFSSPISISYIEIDGVLGPDFHLKRLVNFLKSICNFHKIRVGIEILWFIPKKMGMSRYFEEVVEVLSRTDGYTDFKLGLTTRMWRIRDQSLPIFSSLKFRGVRLI